MILKILLGVFGLGIVVFVHELGHFLAARICGIKVTAFSLGWGPAAIHKEINGVDYRIGFFPVGGYCTMAGESDFRKVYENRKNGVEPEKGDFYGASPVRRMITSFAGPFFNLIFSVIVFSVVMGAGYEFTTLPNRIALAKDVTGKSYPSDRAGLVSGDFITAINGEKTENYHDIQKLIAVNAKKTLDFTILRDGKELNFSIEPELEKETGAGKIGVYFWSDPVIYELKPDGAAARAGLLSGDKIIKWDGEDFPYSAALYKIYKDKEMTGVIPVVYERAGEIFDAEIKMSPQDGGDAGIVWPYIKSKTPDYGFFGSIGQGSILAWETFSASVRGLSLLFSGVDLTKAVSGPVRITYMAGEIAAEGFSGAKISALRNFFEFLALISIALAVMNLLPLPILDGGAIVMFLVELIRGKPAPPRFFFALQTAGVVLIAGLMALALYGDVMFFIRK